MQSSLCIDAGAFRHCVPALSMDELFPLVHAIVRRSARSRASVTNLERRIALLVDEIRQRYEPDDSVTDETIASIATCRILARLRRVSAMGDRGGVWSESVCRL